MGDETATNLGPFHLRIDPDEVAAFSRALGFPSGHSAVPLIYPIRMLTDPNVFSAIKAAAPDGVALIHQAQSFICHSPLLVNHAYRLELRLERFAGHRPHILIRGTITTLDNRLIQEFTTALLVPQQHEQISISHR
jgi:hypothetical protein